MKPVKLVAQNRKSKDITYLIISFQEQQQQKISYRSVTTVIRRFIAVNWISVNFNKNRVRKMSRVKVLFDGEYEDEVFDTEEDAEEYALYLCLRTVKVWKFYI